MGAPNSLSFSPADNFQSFSFAFHLRISATQAKADDKLGSVCYAFTIERRSL